MRCSSALPAHELRDTGEQLIRRIGAQIIGIFLTDHHHVSECVAEFRAHHGLGREVGNRDRTVIGLGERVTGSESALRC